MTMNAQLPLTPGDYDTRAISPLVELGAYEALWLDEKATFKTIAEKFKANPGSVPSDFVPLPVAMEAATAVLKEMHEGGITDFGVRVHGAGEYPPKLRDARHPIELLYFRGWWDLVETRCVAVVGTRKPTPEGMARTARMTRMLVEDGYTIVSGLAQGVDTIAHKTAMELGGRTIAVVGTPLSRCYPKSNTALQARIADEFLIISQVPVLKYLRAKNPKVNSYFFPERNITMSALTMATVIVEAGETSGTLYQARAAIDQGRRLFILDSCFQGDLGWPLKFEAQGAIRVRDFEDVRRNLNDVRPSNENR